MDKFKKQKAKIMQNWLLIALIMHFFTFATYEVENSSFNFPIKNSGFELMGIMPETFGLCFATSYILIAISYLFAHRACIKASKIFAFIAGVQVVFNNHILLDSGFSPTTFVVILMILLGVTVFFNGFISKTLLKEKKEDTEKSEESVSTGEPKSDDRKSKVINWAVFGVVILSIIWSGKKGFAEGADIQGAYLSNSNNSQQSQEASQPSNSSAEKQIYTFEFEDSEAVYTLPSSQPVELFTTSFAQYYYNYKKMTNLQKDDENNRINGRYALGVGKISGVSTDKVASILCTDEEASKAAGLLWPMMGYINAKIVPQQENILYALHKDDEVVVLSRINPYNTSLEGFEGYDCIILYVNGQAVDVPEIDSVDLGARRISSDSIKSDENDFSGVEEDSTEQHTQTTPNPATTEDYYRYENEIKEYIIEIPKSFACDESSTPTNGGGCSFYETGSGDAFIEVYGAFNVLGYTGESYQEEFGNSTAVYAHATENLYVESDYIENGFIYYSAHYFTSGKEVAFTIYYPPNLQEKYDSIIGHMLESVQEN